MGAVLSNFVANIMINVESTILDISFHFSLIISDDISLEKSFKTFPMIYHMTGLVKNEPIIPNGRIHVSYNICYEV